MAMLMTKHSTRARAIGMPSWKAPELASKDSVSARTVLACAISDLKRLNAFGQGLAK